MIIIELPWPDKDLNPNTHKHWRVKYEATKIAKMQGIYLARHAIQNMYKPIRDFFIENCNKATYTFYPPDKRRRDMDNCVAMMKAYQDGVCHALGFDDSRLMLGEPEWGEVVKGGKVVLQLEAM